MNIHAVRFGAHRTVEAPDFLRDTDLSAHELSSLLELALQVKIEPEHYRDSLKHRAVALLFEKPSLRTRMTFELAALQLGGARAAQAG